MRTLLVHLWKEWREHRWILAAIAAAIAILTALGAWALRLTAYDLGRFAPIHTAGGMALAVLAFSTEAFAREGARDGFSFLRRTPRGLGSAFAAKTLFYGVASAGTAVWSAAVLLAVAAGFGGDVGRDEVLFGLRSDETLLFATLVVAAGLWILMASLWIPRGAAAAGAALLLLAALGAPAWFLLRENPAFAVPASWRSGTVAALLVVPLVGSALGLLRGLRVGRHSWSAAWRGLALVALVAGPAYGAGISRLERWKDLSLDQEDVRILQAWVGRDGRYAWVDAYRPAEAGPKGPIVRAFRVDLATGVATPLGPLGTFVSPPYDESANAGWGQGAVDLVYTASGDGESHTWFDAGADGWTKTLPHDVTTPDLLARRREALRRSTLVRTPDGRPTWILDRRVERDEADGSVTSVPLPRGLMGNYGQRYGGWQGCDLAAGTSVILVPSEDGSARAVPYALARSDFAGSRLSPGRYVWRSPPGKPAPEGGPWRISDTVARTEVAARGMGDRDAVVMVVAPNRVLVRRPIDRTGPADLWLVDPIAGDSTILAPPPDAPSTFGDTRVAGWTPDGDLVLSVSDPAGNSNRGWLLLSVRDGVLHSWTPRPGVRVWDESLMAALSDGTAIVLESARRLLRIRWGSPAREALFPR